jgi:hypothetical protein
MKIAILSTTLKKDLFKRFEDFFSGLTIESSAAVLSHRWSLDQRTRLESILSRSDYYVVLADREALASSWLVYCLGYLREEQERVLFYTRFADFRRPPWMDGLIHCRNFQNLRIHIMAAQDDWEGRITREMAIKTLASMGIERANYNFLNALRDCDRLLTGLFLEAGHSPHLRDERGVPLLCHAARKGNLSIMQALLAAGADINQVSEDRGNTPLMDAAAAGTTEIVRYLTTRGADLERTSKSGQTALLLAVGNQRKETARFLLSKGADPMVSDHLGMNALKYAELFGEGDLLELMTKGSPGISSPSPGPTDAG